ncbi:MAG TPA: hypothetical protein VFV63_10320 [Ilumatobacteraceae bacterium]|nr:hypothetical protein [Ilumatobacteraceae bacterium]
MTDASTATDSAPAGVDGEVDVDLLDAELANLIALSPEDQEARLAALDAELERELWTISGLEAALGGPEAADAAFAAHSEAIVGWAREIVAAPIVMSGLRRPAAAPAAPNLGEGLFGGILVVMLGADSIVSSTNDVRDGEVGAAKWGEHTTVSGSLEHVEMITDLPPFESHGVTTKLRVQIEVDPCPDATGHFEGKATIDVSTTTAGGSTGQEGILDLTITGQVDDDAKLASTDVDYRMQWAEFAGGTSSLVDVSGSIGDTKAVGATLTQSGAGPASATLRQSASSLSVMYAYLGAHTVAEAAQKGWQSGRCVRLQPTASPGPKGLKTSSTSTISAPPRSRIDGLPAGGTVTATLTAGGAGVEPSATKVAADATFTYTAPGEINKSGTVSLEARSKRGVAKASIDFDTVGTYTASGGTEVTFSGTIADLAAPFTLQGAGQGFDVEFAFTPASPTAGALAYTGSGDGFTMQGSGTYTIAGADPDPLTLTYNANGCVDIGGCRATTSAITLTRTP